MREILRNLATTPTGTRHLHRSITASLQEDFKESGATHPVALHAQVLGLLRTLPSQLPSLLLTNLGPLLLLVAFAAFVFFNGGVVLGDKANHKPTIHGAQLLYLTVLSAAPFEMRNLSLGLPRTLRAGLGAATRAPLVALICAGLAFGGAHLTYAHPFLLADNRHVTFYAWRYVLGRHWAVRYALVPGYLLLGWLLYPRIWRAQGALRAFFLFACVGLVLVPTPLLEPRYFTLPALLLRLHAPPLQGARQWLPPVRSPPAHPPPADPGVIRVTCCSETMTCRRLSPRQLLLFYAVNVGMFALFLGRPYTWGDGTVARFMW